MSVSEHNVPPRYYLVPSLRNKNFTGRSAILEDIQQRLFLRQECRKLAIFGLGGVGKTQVALQLAHWARENQPDHSIFWVPALSVASFTQSYLEIGQCIGVQKKNDNDDPLELIQRHLNSADAGPWLLIVDNADDKDVLFGPTGIHQYLPDSEVGLTLFTTRTLEVGVSVATNDVVELHDMDPQEAEDYLRKSLIRKQLLQDQAMTAELLRELTHLPLAITQAAAYLNWNSQISIKRYLELLRGTEQDMVGLMSREFHDNTRYRGSQNAVATTWLVSFDLIQKSNSAAADLLAFISHIEPKAIPRSLLPTSKSKEAMESELGTLSAFAFLARREDNGDDEVYDMHKLVHLATGIWIRKHEMFEATTARALQHFSTTASATYPSSQELPQAFLSHAFRLLDVNAMLSSAERFKLADKVGCSLLGDTRIGEAIRHLEGNLNSAKIHLAVTNSSRLRMEINLAVAYISIRRFCEAVSILEHVIEIHRRIHGEEDVRRQVSQEVLARAYMGTGQSKKAIQILEHALTIRRRTFGEKEYDIFGHKLESMSWLANAYALDGQSRRAIQILECLHSSLLSKLGEDDHYRVSSEYNLAVTYMTAGRFEDAIPLLNRVVSVRARTHGTEDLDTLVSEECLGSAYMRNGKVKEAIDILEHVVTTYASMHHEDEVSLSVQAKDLLKEAYGML